MDLDNIITDSQALLAVKEEVVCTQGNDNSKLSERGKYHHDSARNKKDSNSFIDDRNNFIPIIVGSELSIANEIAVGNSSAGNGVNANNSDDQEMRREAIPLQTRFPLSSSRGRRGSQIRYRVVEESECNDDASDRMSNDDPRTTMHYVKYLKREGKTHKIWECGICSKEFRHQYTLMRHLPTHTDERNFKCETCGKGFRQMSTLSQHRAIHSDARPYVCELCTKTFNRVSTLISHRKTHSDHKPHKCPVCGKGFHQKGNLRNHIFTHTNERPYKCEDCGKGFNQMSNLMCHKVKSHSQGEKFLYTCHVCNIQFNRKYALKSHEQFAHNIKQPQGNTILQKFHNPQLLNQTKNDDNFTQTQSPERNENIMDFISNGQNNIMSPTNIMNPKLANSLGIIIESINTKAMLTTKANGQIPFALLKLAKGNPVLVKVIDTSFETQMLVPASAEDLRCAQDVTISPHSSKGETSKALQIKVPIVATVIQKISAEGNVSMHVASPEHEPQFLQQRDGECKIRDNLSMHVNSSFMGDSLFDNNDLSVSMDKDNFNNFNPFSLMNDHHLDSAIQGLIESSNGVEFMYPTGETMGYQILGHEDSFQMMQPTEQIIEVGSEEEKPDKQESLPDTALEAENGMPNLMESICPAYTIDSNNILGADSSSLNQDRFECAENQGNQ